MIGGMCVASNESFPAPGSRARCVSVRRSAEQSASPAKSVQCFAVVVRDSPAIDLQLWCPILRERGGRRGGVEEGCT